MRLIATVVWFVTSVVFIVAGQSAEAADTFYWTGDVSDSFKTSGNWDPPGPPANTDIAVIDDTTVHDTCIIDTTYNVILDGLELEGLGATKMTLFVKDKTLQVEDRFCHFYDYARLLADNNFTSLYDTDFRDDVWIEVAANTSSTITVHFQANADVDTNGTTTLYVDDHSTGVVLFDVLNIDADAGNGSRGLKLDAPNSKATVLDRLNLISDPGSTTDTWKAKLWVYAGTLAIQSGSPSDPAVLDINGGVNGWHDADIDVDATLVADQTEISGYGKIDIAAGVTVYAGDVHFIGGSTLNFRKTGPTSGLFKSGSPP